MSTIHEEWGEESALARLWTSLTELAGAREMPVSVEFVCDVAADRLGMSAACLIVSGKAGTAELRYAGGELGERIAELEVTVGEGPVRESLDLASTLFMPDLDAPKSLLRWPLFAPLAIEAGARACFMFPLALGVVRAGVFALYRGEPGLPEPERLGEALLFADLLLALLLTEQAGQEPAAAAEGFPLVGIDVHQATGMVAAQLDTDLDDAFARLRARAFADGRRLADVAADVVARKLRFEPDPGLG